MKIGNKVLTSFIVVTLSISSGILWIDWDHENDAYYSPDLQNPAGASDKEMTEYTDGPVKDSIDNTDLASNLADDDNDDANMGALQIMLMDAPIDDVQAVNVRFEGVEVHFSGGGWITFSDTPMEIDLLSLRDGLMESLGLDELPMGHYTQIRLKLEEVELIANNQSHDVTVPSGMQNGIKLVTPFDIIPGNVTILTLDFDAKKSLHYNKAKGWILRPTIKLISEVVEPIIILDPLQLTDLQRLEGDSHVPIEIRFDPTLIVPEYFAGEWDVDPALTDPGDQTVGFMNTYPDLFRIDQYLGGFEIESVKDSRLGFKNVRLNQTYKGLRVFGAEFIVHIQNDMIIFAHGNLVPDVDIGINPVLAPSEAITIVEFDLTSRISGVQILSVESPMLCIYNEAIFDAEIHGFDFLAYFVEVRTDEPGAQWYYFVDALTGTVVDY